MAQIARRGIAKVAVERADRVAGSVPLASTQDRAIETFAHGFKRPSDRAMLAWNGTRSNFDGGRAVDLVD